jgi:hypothetical protein
MFDCIHLTMQYYFDALEMEYAGDLFFNQVDEKGAILKHPTAVRDAYGLGKTVAAE